MTISVLLLIETVLALCAAKAVYQVIYNLYLSPLKHFPGPILYRATSIPFDIEWVNGRSHIALTRLHDKYGPIVRVRPNELSYIDGRVWKEVYGYRSGHEEWFKGDGFKYVNGTPGITLAPKEAHRRYRRSLAHAFSNQGLKEQTPRIQGYADELVAILEKYKDLGPVDMVKWLSWTTTDIIGDLAFGESFDCLKSEKEHHFLALTFKVLRPALVIAVLERWNLMILAFFLLPGDTIPGIKSNAQYIWEKLQKRLSYGKARGDFFDYLLKHDLVVDSENGFKEMKEGQEGFTIQELESNAQDFVFAGSETTATVLSGAIYFLLRNPRALASVAQEVRTRFSRSEDITVASTNALDMPYLDAVCHETMRIYDPVPLFAARVAPKGGDTINGAYVPEGTRVQCAKYVANRSEYNFAKPHDFVPERWFPVGEGRPKTFENDNRHGVFLPFSFGSRNCLGINMAKAEMHLILAKLLWQFDFSRPNLSTKEKDEWDLWVERQKVWFLWMKPPLMVDVKKRKDVSVCRQEYNRSI
ncbi:cytochrome P450 monooxygenase [Truncatella angustata]|uniref:Cytochrome P450 monooxygenase n=1 Tax=Truncatella angustata TaxID=152316 RepID=A0A9P8UVF5_9PEZI|nr:cytochrome P450 monooxygenase [Truncatella angustata]KAH6659113.1 cytochrome P450 monooxygenase [Truncatella angustata]